MENTANSSSKLKNSYLFIMVALVGIVMAPYTTFIPLKKYFDAKKWDQVSCEVLSSNVGRSGDTYTTNIVYRYEFEGKSYTNHVYDFFNVSSSSHSHHSKQVQTHPKGLVFPCFVNPKDPQESIIDRTLGWDFLFALAPLPFLLFGFGVIYAAFKKPSKDVQSAQTDSNRMVLKESITPLNKFIFTLIGCIVVNIIVFIILNQWILPDYEASQLEITTILVGGAFAFFGIVLLLGTFTTFLSLFNPIISLEINSSSLIPGESYSLTYTFAGNFKKLKELNITLVCTEKVTYASGDSTKTDDAVIHQSSIYQERRVIQQNGIIPLNLPQSIMPSFSANHNKIEWTINVKGEIPFAPDLAQEFPITISSEIKRVESWLSL